MLKIASAETDTLDPFGEPAPQPKSVCAFFVAIRSEPAAGTARPAAECGKSDTRRLRQLALVWGRGQFAAMSLAPALAPAGLVCRTKSSPSR